MITERSNIFIKEKNKKFVRKNYQQLRKKNQFIRLKKKY